MRQLNALSCNQLIFIPFSSRKRKTLSRNSGESNRTPIMRDGYAGVARLVPAHAHLVALEPMGKDSCLLVALDRSTKTVTVAVFGVVGGKDHFLGVDPPESRRLYAPRDGGSVDWDAHKRPCDSRSV